MNSPNPNLTLNPISSQIPAPAPRPSPQPQSSCRSSRRQSKAIPTLVLAPLAFLKLQFFLHAGDTEIGGFALSRKDDLLYVEDFVILRQLVSCVTVEFDDVAIADYFDRMVDAGKAPAQFARIWMHTHPGSSPLPSSTDERTFERVFGRCDWSIMFIMARSGQTYARLQFAAGPRAEVLLPVQVDWSAWAEMIADLGGERLGELAEGWMDEYGQNIQPLIEMPSVCSCIRLVNDNPCESLVPFPPPCRDHWFDEQDRINDPDEDWAEMNQALAETDEDLAIEEYFNKEVFS